MGCEGVEKTEEWNKEYPPVISWANWVIVVALTEGKNRVWAGLGGDGKGKWEMSLRLKLIRYIQVGCLKVTD